MAELSIWDLPESTFVAVEPAFQNQLIEKAANEVGSLYALAKKLSENEREQRGYEGSYYLRTGKQHNVPLRILRKLVQISGANIKTSRTKGADHTVLRERNSRQNEAPPSDNTAV